MMERVRFLFNAPYSPEFNPVELIFNIIKKMVKESISLTEEDLIIRVINKIRLITPEMCKKSFLHCIKLYYKFA